jgi:MerR family transcriptional regulator, mercuric resistance operon regulatory protein
MTQAGYTIGHLARAAGVNVETVRYYHRRGLLPLPGRIYGAARRYSDESLARLCFIRRAQRLGFALDEVAALLQLNDGRSCSAARGLAERRLAEVEERLKGLSALRDQLSGLVRRCLTERGKVHCPLIDALSEN